MKYFIEDTTLTGIADAVREKEESTQPIPVLELAGRIRDIQSGAQLAVTLNDDGTQNLSILDDGKTFDLPSLTADADATPEDVADGKVFYAKGYRYVGTGGGDPVLLWTNASPTSAFAEQTVTVGSGYDGYLLELKMSTTVAKYTTVLLGTSGTGNELYGIIANAATSYSRYITPTSSGVIFSGGLEGTTSNNNACIPTRIFGVKFTL